MIASFRARLAANPLLVDAVIAFGLTALSLFAVVAGAQDAGSRSPLSIALLLLETLPLLIRRRWPIQVLIVTTVATLAHASLADAAGGLNESLGALVALYTVAERSDRRTSIALALVVAASFATLIIVKGTMPEGLGGLLQTMLSVLFAWAFGDWTRTRRLFADALEDRARLLEAEQEEQARRAVQDERERIARELHDVVTHHVSVIVIQAGAALTAVDRRPEQARTALQAIDRTGRQALTDMRRMLGILGEPLDAPEAREPMPGLDRLGELLDEVRAAGLPVELATAGDRRPLDAGVELSAYRIVQEALTNALKHARGARARVDLRFEPDALEIQVVDEGGQGRRDLGEAGQGGHGLIGMRERVAMFGGHLDAAPTPTGFRVAARLPLEPDPVVAA